MLSNLVINSNNKLTTLKVNGVCLNLLGQYVDGLHIPVSLPNLSHIDYYNRKGLYSVLIQAVVDYKCNIYLNKNSPGLLKKGVAKQSRIKSIAWHLRWLVRTRADIGLRPSGLVRSRTDIKLQPSELVR